jgi:hypothetical protein
MISIKKTAAASLEVEITSYSFLNFSAGRINFKALQKRNATGHYIRKSLNNKSSKHCKNEMQQVTIFRKL